LSRAGSAAVGPVHAGKQSVTGLALHLDGAEPGLSLRWLPHAILGGLGLSAVAIVVVYYLFGFSSQPTELSAAPTAIDGGLEANALANPRIARGDPQTPAAEIRQDLVTSPVAGPVAERPVPAPSMTLASEEPLPSEPPPPEPLPAEALPSSEPLPSEPLASEPLPSEPLASAALPSVPLATRPASVAAADPVKPRAVPPKPERAALASTVPASRAEHRVLPTAPVPGPELRQEALSAPVSQREANRILGRFSKVYEDGDLAGMRAMFTADATSPDGGLDAILGEYHQLFGRSKHRLLDVQDVNWSASGRTFTIVANYEATVKTGLLARTRSQGKLRMEMRQVDDQWRIYRLEHDERND
jgi:hypothetical protein